MFRVAVVRELINGYGTQDIYSLKDGIYDRVKTRCPVESYNGTFQMKLIESKY